MKPKCQQTEFSVDTVADADNHKSPLDGPAKTRFWDSPPAADGVSACLSAGKQARQRGDNAKAIGHFREAIRLQSDCVPAYNNLANALQAEGDLDGALASARQAIEIDPERAILHCTLASLLWMNDDTDAAIAAYQHAISLDPALHLAHHNLGKLLIAEKRWEEALQAFDAAQQTQAPPSTETLLQRGQVLTQLQRHQEALIAYEQALAQTPDSAQAYINQSATLLACREHSLACLSAQQAIALNPRSVPAYYNRGLALSRMNRCRAALADNRRALDCQPDNADAHWNTSLDHLRLGDYGAGWPEYEWRWQRTGADRQRYPDRPRWNGQQDLQGKTILLHAEQGLGDSIQFSRYVPLVAQRGARVLLEVNAAVAPLFVHLPGVSDLLVRPPGDSDGEASFDLHAPLLSLPLAFGTTLETIPAQTPYLHAHPKRLAEWRARIGERTRLRIGLAWSGNAHHQGDSERSLPLADLATLIQPQWACYSLQREVRPSDQAALAAQDNLCHFGEQLRDFSDTAALIAQLDLVISVDTAVAPSGRCPWQTGVDTAPLSPRLALDAQTR